MMQFSKITTNLFTIVCQKKNKEDIALLKNLKKLNKSFEKGKEIF